MKKENHMIISTDAEKALQNSTLFLIETLNKLGREGNYLNIIKVTYENSTANRIFYGQK